MTILAEIAKLQGSRPVPKVEFIDTDGAVTDITSYYAGALAVERRKERTPTEIQAGDFDIELRNSDNKFSEFNASSLIYNMQYHGARIRYSQGMRESDGTVNYDVQAIGFIDEIVAHDDESLVTFRCRDMLRTILDHTLHERPEAETPVYNSANTGDGTCTIIETKPFKTVDEDWTLTCTTPGGAGVAIFDVVGSVSGDVGDATDGTIFSTGTSDGGIKFTIDAGTTAWAVDDEVTFSTKQYPEWSGVNPAKIIWSILTGYNYDSDTQEAWSGHVLALDHTQGSDNTDIDFSSFQLAVSDLSGNSFTGYIGYGEEASEIMVGILLLFMGSLYTNCDGKMAIQTWKPVFGDNVFTHFKDTIKNSTFGYYRTVDEVINYVSVSYMRTPAWVFSGETLVYNGQYVDSDATSIAKYGRRTPPEAYSIRWYSSSTAHIEDFAEKLIGKYTDPPIIYKFTTGLDALLTEMGDRIYITDAKYSVSGAPAEITRITKDYSDEPISIHIEAKHDADINLQWAFLGSSEVAGSLLLAGGAKILLSDGVSEIITAGGQAADWDNADTEDRRFAYLSQTGGGGPDYRMF